MENNETDLSVAFTEFGKKCKEALEPVIEGIIKSFKDVWEQISQKDIVLNHLRKYGSISTMECYSKYRIADLQHAIYLLRKENYKITDEWVKSKNSLGWANKYKKYTLVED